MAKKLPPESPGPEIPWPPIGGTEIFATPFDDWWTVATAAGRSNVWDVIYFNFNTVDGKRVNYYMRTMLGCHAQKKGNWKFGRKDGSPSVLYKPPANWKCVVGLPQAPARPAMSGWDTATALIARAALHSFATSTIRFKQGPYAINPFDFHRIADRIQNGTLSVYAVAANAKKAGYNPEDQAFYLRSGVGLNDQSTIVHEAVHAIFDLEKRHNILTKEDEASAYLAQTIFVQRATGSDVRQLLLRGHDAIFQEAFLLWRDKYRGGGSPSYADFQPLREAIAADTEYSADANLVAGYDGLYEVAPV